MRAIFIDVIRKSVSEIEIEAGLENIYRVLECSMIECPYFAEQKNGDSLFVDEEALLKNEVKGVFIFDGNSLVGHGLILGLDHENGNSVDAKSTLEEIKSKVYFPMKIEIPEPTVMVTAW